MSLDCFFKPRGIALIGATKKLKGGYAILYNLKKGFDGPIYPVNPRYDEIEGLKCYARVTDVPDPVDLAIVFVPGHLVFDVVVHCAERGIKGVMIESAGFAETGPGGRAMQEKLLAFAKKHGVRLWGPNCMGMVDPRNRHVFSFVSPTIWDEGLLAGDVSLVVQSGMLSGGFLTDTMTHGTMGVSKVLSIGNKMDVEETELLEYLLDDKDTKAVGLYLESVKRPRDFVAACKKARKPVVVLKGGQSEKGASAALSHTASLAGQTGVVNGALAQAGVTRATDFKQMMDLTRTLAMYPDGKAKGPGRVAVLTYSGGAGILSADFFENLGLATAELSEKTVETLNTVYPDWMAPGNPVDLWPSIEKNGAIAYEVAMKAVCADDGVDAVLAHMYVGGAAMNPDMDALIDIAQQAGKPLFIWLLGSRTKAREFHIKVQERGVPVFRELFRAAECMAAVFDRARNRPDPEEAHKKPPSFSPEVQNLLDTSSGVLDEMDSKKILARAGIPVVGEAAAESAKQAGELAGRMGFPVVLKGLVPGEAHKTEKNLLRLNLADEKSVAQAFDELSQAVEPAGRVIVQKQVSGRVELILGALHDEQFGPCVMVGLGGVFAEVLADRVFALAPLTPKEAKDLLARLKNHRVLEGFRGEAPADTDALARALVDLGNLIASCPKIREVDINPLIIHKGSPLAVDATVVLG